MWAPALDLQQQGEGTCSRMPAGDHLPRESLRGQFSDDPFRAQVGSAGVVGIYRKPC